MGFLLHFEFGLNRGQIILGLCTLLEALVTVPLCLSFEPIELCPCVLEFALLGFEATICFGNRLQGIRACCSGPLLESGPSHSNVITDEFPAFSYGYRHPKPPACA